MSPFPVASRAMKVPLQALGSQSLLSAPLSCGQQHGAWVSGCVGGAAPHGGRGAGGGVAPSRAHQTQTPGGLAGLPLSGAETGCWGLGSAPRPTSGIGEFGSGEV